MVFENLEIGDVFRVKSGDFVKTNNTEGMSINSSVHELGSVLSFNLQTEIIVLYSRKVTSEYNKLLKYCDYLKECIRWENSHPDSFEDWQKPHATQMGR